MSDPFEELLRAGAWLGPAVLGALCVRVLTQSQLGGDDFAGAMMLGTAALVMTAVGVRANSGKNAVIAPVAFVAMFIASWSML